MESAPLETVSLGTPEVAADRRPILGVARLLLAIAGLSLAILQPHIAKALEPPKAPAMTAEQLADAALDAGGRFARRVVDRARGKAIPPAAPAPVPEKVLPWDWYLDLSSSGLGLLAAIAGLVGWLRHEDRQIIAPVFVISFLAVAWIHILAAVVIAIVILIVAKFA